MAKKKIQPEVKLPVFEAKPREIKTGSFTDIELGEALIDCHGLQWLAAEMVGIAATNMCKRVKSSPYLQEVIDFCRQRRLDRAERKLIKLIEEKEDFAPLCFFLKTKGKERGYEEAPQVVVDPEHMNKYDGLMSSIKQLQDSLRPRSDSMSSKTSDSEE
jgi:hypothetical protein